MTAVLLESVRPVGSSWTRVPKSGGRLVFSGLNEDKLRVEFWNAERSSMLVATNGEMEIPSGCKRIRVVHVIASGSPVSVDLER